MENFWLVFSAKRPVKSDKLALIEGKILNLMFLDIYIPVVPIENWLRSIHNQRQKTVKVASVLLFRHILKTSSWLTRPHASSLSLLVFGVVACVAGVWK